MFLQSSVLFFFTGLFLINLNACGKHVDNNANLDSFKSVKSSFFSNQSVYLWSHDLIIEKAGLTDTEKVKGDDYLFAVGKKRIYQCWYEGSSSTSEVNAFTNAKQISKGYVWQKAVVSEVMGEMEANAALRETKLQLVSDLFQRAHNIGCPLSSIVSEFALKALAISRGKVLSYTKALEIIKKISKGNSNVTETCRNWLLKVENAWKFGQYLTKAFNNNEEVEQAYSFEIYKKIQKQMTSYDVILSPEMNNLIKTTIIESSVLPGHSCPAISSLNLVDGVLKRK